MSLARAARSLVWQSRLHFGVERNILGGICILCTGTGFFVGQSALRVCFISLVCSFSLSFWNINCNKVFPLRCVCCSVLRSLSLPEHRASSRIRSTC